MIKFIDRNEDNKPPPLAYSIEGLAEGTSLSRALIYEHIKAGLLETRKCGRRTIVMREDAMRWLASLNSSR